MSASSLMRISRPSRSLDSIQCGAIDGLNVKKATGYKMSLWCSVQRTRKFSDYPLKHRNACTQLGSMQHEL